MPFEILGAVVLPDHLHFLWQLPPDDDNYSKRVGKIKVTFTKSFQRQNSSSEQISLSRQNIWQRRFWEHTIKDELDFAQHLDYIHYNPVKHNLVIIQEVVKISKIKLFHEKEEN